MGMEMRMAGYAGDGRPTLFHHSFLVETVKYRGFIVATYYRRGQQFSANDKKNVGKISDGCKDMQGVYQVCFVWVCG